MAKARGNKVAVTFAAQSISQLQEAYAKDTAAVLYTLPGNIFCGQVISDTAKALSETIGRIVQTKLSINENERGRHYSQSENLASAVLPSSIAGLPSGEFVGCVADDRHQRIRNKAFHGEILANNKVIRKEQECYLPLPIMDKEPSLEELKKNFENIKGEVSEMITERLGTMNRSPILAKKVIIEQGMKSPNLKK